MTADSNSSTTTGRIRVSALALALALGVLAGGCEDGVAPDPGTLRFGQVGEMRLLLETPLAFGVGMLRQELEWRDDGVWSLLESVFYDGVEGDSDQVLLAGNLEVSAGLYAQWIVHVNETAALDLFVPELDPFLDPECPDLRSRVTLTIRDRGRGEEISWTRCTVGSLGVLTPVGAGPDPAAARVVSAAGLVRDNTVGQDFESTYAGTIPFATIERGEDSGAPLTGPRSIDNPDDWVAFWTEHARSQGAPPQVDFERDMVLVGAVGERREAGVEVEVRRVLAVIQGTIVTLFERVPGNFCSPAEVRHVPFHIVRVPRVPQPVGYAEVGIERVPCG